METINPFDIKGYNPQIDNLVKLNEVVASAYQTNLLFFEHPVFGIEIYYVYTDEELAQNMPFPFQKWHKGYATGNKLYLFSPSTPKGANSQTRLTHEMAHTFTTRLFGEFRPAWLREGLAGFVAGQDKGELDNNPEFGFDKVHTGLQWQAHPYYLRSTQFVKFLIDSWGKAQLFLLLGKIIPEIGDSNGYEQFCALYHQVYGQSLEATYQVFSKNLPGVIDKQLP